MAPREMTEIKAPEMFKFANDGDYLNGVLLAITSTKVNGKPAREYLLRGELGRKFTFLGTYDLDRKLSREHVGRFIFIRFEGEDKSVQREGQNALKRFQVKVDLQSEVEREELQITDADVPF